MQLRIQQKTVTIVNLKMKTISCFQVIDTGKGIDTVIKLKFLIEYFQVPGSQKI
jgi:hypothetical protein